MKLIKTFAISTALPGLIFLALAGSSRAEESGAAVDSNLVAANTRFAFKLFDEIVKQDFGRNIFVSPSSISFALAMTYNGADGQTKEAMAKTLELQELSLEDVNQANAALMKTLADPDPDVKLSIANSLWAREEIDFKEDFLERNRSFYQAEVTNLNFGDPSAPDSINAWVKEKTNGKIPKIIGEIDPYAILFLINAIYFKGTWTVKFDSAKTKDLDFHLLDGSKKKHPMMSQFGNYHYYQGEKFQAISLPYGTERVSMYIFLPDTASSLKEFHQSLTAENWDVWMRHLAYGKPKGTIVLPRFKLEYERKLNEILIAMNMAIAFDQVRANFRPMAHIGPEQNLYIQEVKHKTFVEVNEEGTEAAAVTSVGIGITSVQPPPFRMVVDRPFFCAIRDNATGTLLFMGYIVDPQ